MPQNDDVSRLVKQSRDLLTLFPIPTHTDTNIQKLGVQYRVHRHFHQLRSHLLQLRRPTNLPQMCAVQTFRRRPRRNIFRRDDFANTDTVSGNATGPEPFAKFFTYRNR